MRERVLGCVAFVNRIAIRLAVNGNIGFPFTRKDISPMRLFRFSLLTAYALALASAGGVAMAQTPQQTPPAAATEAPRTHTRMSLNEHFAAANTTNDGHLTEAQAKAGMPSIARHFAAIDKDNKGYVTLDEIHAYYREQRAARHQTGSDKSSG
jgi:hypothetical protein